MSIATATHEALEQRTPSPETVEISVGSEWMTHKELAAIGGYPHTDCDGVVRFVDVRKPIKEAACDEIGCHFTVTAREPAIARSRQGREERWYQR